MADLGQFQPLSGRSGHGTDRSRFIAMTGLGERTGRRVLASLLDYGVLSAESSRSPVAFTVPLKSLKYLFPNLWPEAEVE